MNTGGWILAVETSGRVGSVALGRLGEGGPTGQPVDDDASRPLSGDRRHTAELFPIVSEMLAERGIGLADVGVYAYSSGPGSFTGLRIAATVGRMLHSAIGCRVVAVSTLEVIARNALSHPERPERIVALLDAKRGEAYIAAYERAADGALCELQPPGVHAPGEWLATLDQPFVLCGEGVKHHCETLGPFAGSILDEGYWPPSAGHVLAIGRRLARAGAFCRPAEILPVYLRPPECEEVYEERRAAARARRGE